MLITIGALRVDMARLDWRVPFMDHRWPNYGVPLNKMFKLEHKAIRSNVPFWCERRAF